MKHIRFIANDKAGVCDACLDFKESRYRFVVNPKRTELRCAGCIAKALGATLEIKEVEPA
ncbi:MAG: hypothetical protein AAF564_17800 [Bacteroidota bacterium]